MEAYRLERHFKLWEDNNTLIRRVVLLTLVLAIALVFKVLTPFVAHSEDKGPVLARIEALNQEKIGVNDKLQVVEGTEAVLKHVNQFIADQPWQQEKEELIRRYQQMRAGHTRDSYQREADQTIRKIARMLRQSVVWPLRQSAGAGGTRGQDVERLSTEVASLEGFVAGWQAEYAGKRWYDTIRGKDDTMFDLSRALNERLTEFSRVVQQELVAVQRSRQAVNEELQSLKNQIDTEAEKLAEIEKELQAVLPDWVKGLLETHQMIQLLPLLLVGGSVSVLAIGVNLTRHYQRYVFGKQLDAAVTAEPAMSSTWTLIRRGRFGTALTLAAYSLFFLTSWALLETSLDLLLAWLAVDSSAAWVASPQAWEGFRWFSRIVFVSLIFYAWFAPWRSDKAIQS